MRQMTDMERNQVNTDKTDLIQDVKFIQEEHKDGAKTAFLNGTEKPEASTVWTKDNNDGPDAATHNIPPIRTLLALSLSFNLVFTAFNGIQNLQSSINQTAGLGMITMAVAYGMNPIVVPLGPTILRKFGCKRLLLASWVSMAAFVASNFYTSFYTLIAGALILGIICSQAGTIGVVYTTGISHSYVASHRLGPKRHHNILSLVNGIFYTFWESTQVTGNLISSVVLSSGDTPVPDNSTVIDTSVCGAAMCADSAANSTALAQPAKEAVYILFGVFLACVIAGFLIAAAFLPHVYPASSQVKQTVFQGCLSCYKMLLDRRCLLLVPLFMAQSTMIIFVYTGFTKAYISCTLGVRWVGFIMMVFGTSTAVCATAINSLSRFLDRKVLITIFIFTDSSLALTLLFWSPGPGSTKTVLFCIAALAGVSQGISQAQFNALISTVFHDNLVPACVIYLMTKNFAAAICLGVSDFVCVYQRLYATLILYIIGFAGYVTTEVHLYRGNKLTGGVSDFLSHDMKVIPEA